MSQSAQMGMQILPTLSEEDAKSVLDYMLFIQTKCKISIDYVDETTALEVANKFINEYRKAYEVLGQ